MSKETVALPVIEDALAPKGGIKPAVRAQMKEQAIAKFEADGFELTPKGKMVKAIADLDGSIAYLSIDIAVTNSDTLFDAPAAKAPKEDAAPVEIPELV